jgi:hypothetical protein
MTKICWDAAKMEVWIALRSKQRSAMDVSKCLHFAYTILFAPFSKIKSLSKGYNRHIWLTIISQFLSKTTSLQNLPKFKNKIDKIETSQLIIEPS